MKKKSVNVTFYGQNLDEVDLSDHNGNLPDIEDYGGLAENAVIDIAPIYIKHDGATYQSSGKKRYLVWAAILLLVAVSVWFSTSMELSLKQEKEGDLKKLGSMMFYESKTFDHKNLQPSYHIVEDAEFDEAFGSMVHEILGGESGYVYRYLNVKASNRTKGESKKEIVVNIMKGDKKRVLVIPYSLAYEGAGDLSYVINSVNGKYSINFLKKDGVTHPNHVVISDLVDINRAIKIVNQ